MSTINSVNNITIHQADNSISAPSQVQSDTNSPDFTTVLTKMISANSAVQSSQTFVGSLPNVAMSTVTMPSSVLPQAVTFMPSDDSRLEQALADAAATGDLDNTQIALFMLMMMMQSSTDGNFGPQMQIMAAIINSMTDQSRDAARSNAMSSAFHPYILDTVDRQIFGHQTPEITATGQPILPVDAWRPTTPAITSDVNNRSPELFRAVVNQFNVETAERYRPGRNGNTFCNIFVWDVTGAMGAEIPHFTDPTTGDPMQYPNIRSARHMGAIATCEWLSEHGGRFGWREVDAKTAQLHANQGRPAITSAGSLGHVQVVVPSTNGDFDPIRGVTIAQAGRINSNYMFISGIYSANTLATRVRYWVHD